MNRVDVHFCVARPGSSLPHEFLACPAKLEIKAPRTVFMSPNEELARYINLKLAALGQPLCHHTADLQFLKIAGPLLRRLHQKEQLLGSWLSPVDARIQSFLDAYLSDVCPQGAARIPAITFNLDRPGMGRAVSLPAKAPSLDRKSVVEGKSV